MSSLCSKVDAGAGSGGDTRKVGGLFVGSFNINSGDLSMEHARAWLKRADDADIIALGLQECATVPANPFPRPTNAKAKARWGNLKDVLVPGNSSHGECDGEARAEAEEGDAGGGRWGSSGLAGVAEAAMKAAARKSNELGGAHDAHDTDDTDVAHEDAAQVSAEHGEVKGTKESGNPDTCIPTSPGPARRGQEQGQAGDEGSSSTMMRQESYYLRGAVEAERDKNFLSTIADCIPGRHLVADVAMGETPTHGKIEVDVSRNFPSRTASKTSLRDGMPSSSSSTAAVEAAVAATSGAETSVEELDALGGDGPLDASGRPGWPVRHGSSCSSSSSKGDLGASASNGAVLKKVEWYGTIRLLVFVREGLFKDLKVRTVVIPAGDKPSVVADAPEDYAKDTSPDKGAVACYLEDESADRPLQLLLVNCHLYGTNKYSVKEAVFDKYRMAQLRAIDSALAETLPTAATAPLVLLGDVNFRVEVLSGMEDKARGGRDFEEVRKVVEECDAKDLLDLYNKADRLRLVLEGGGGNDEDKARDSPCTEEGALEDEGGEGGRVCQGATPAALQAEQIPELPGLLKGLTDGLRSSLMHGNVVRPTFTYKPWDTSSTPRRFNDKRTPSWTDRVLWRGFPGDETVFQPQTHTNTESEGHSPGHRMQNAQHGNATFAAVPEVIASDHEPVYCLLSLPPAPAPAPALTP